MFNESDMRPHILSPDDWSRVADSWPNSLERTSSRVGDFTVVGELAKVEWLDRSVEGAHVLFSWAGRLF